MRPQLAVLGSFCSAVIGALLVARANTVEPVASLGMALGLLGFLTVMLGRFFGQTQVDRAIVTAGGAVGAMAAVVVADIGVGPVPVAGIALLGIGGVFASFASDSQATALLAIGGAVAATLPVQTGVLLLVLAVVAAELVGPLIAGILRTEPSSALVHAATATQHLPGEMSSDPRSTLVSDDTVPQVPRTADSPPQRLIAVEEKDHRSSSEADRIGDAFITIGASPRLLRTDEADLPIVRSASISSHEYSGYQHGALVIRAASHVGTRHLHNGEPRQDAFALNRSADGRFVIAAVADGVGGARLSALGSQWAASAAVSAAATLLARGAAPQQAVEVASPVSRRIERLARAMFGDDVDLTAFATTLVVALIDDESQDVFLMRVGDSSAAIRRATDWQLGFDTDDEVGAATNALPHEAPATETRQLQLRAGECLLMATDGIADLLAHSQEVAVEIHQRLAMPLSPLGFSAVAGFQRQQAHDDQTAVAIWRGRSATTVGER